MRPGRRIGVGLALAVVVSIVTVAWMRHRSEPRWQGRSVTEWLLHLEQYQSESRQSRGAVVLPGTASPESPEERRRRAEQARQEMEIARNALRQIGTNGFPVLGRMLEVTDSTVRKELVSWSREFPSGFWRLRSDAEWHRMGSEGFQLFGDEAISHLLGCLENGTAAGRRNAIRLLADIRMRGPTVVPRLAAALSDSDGSVRLHAARALAQWGRGPVEPLIQALSDPDAELRSAVVQTLGGTLQESSRTRPRLVAMLADGDNGVQVAVIGALARLGEDSQEYVTHLVTHLDGPLQQACAQALGSVGPVATNAVPRLWRIVTSDQAEGDMRQAALRALGEILRHGPVSPEWVERIEGLLASDDLSSLAVQVLGGWGAAGVPALVRVLEASHDRPDVVENALEALEEMGDDAEGAIPAILRCAGDPNEEIARRARRVLEGMPPSAIPRLLETLDPAVPATWAVSVRLLGAFGHREEGFLRTLVEALTQATLAPTAAEVLGSLGAEPEWVIPALVRGAEAAADATTRLAAVDAMGRFGKEGGAAVECLLGLLSIHAGAWGSSSPTEPLPDGTTALSGEAERILALHAAGSLARVAPQAEEVRPVIESALRRGTAEQRAFAVDIVRNTDVDGAFAVPALLELLKGDDLWLRVRAAESLGKTKSGAEAAVPVLIAAMGDPSWRGYSGAVESALARIGRPAVAGLVELLTDASKRNRALWALQGMGAEGAVAAPHLVRLLSEAEAETRRSACRCLMGLETNAISVRLALGRLAEAIDGEPSILANLARAVIDPGDVPAWNATVLALEDERDGIRELAAVALRQRGPMAGEAVSALVAALHGPFEAQVVRREIVGTLGVLAPESPVALRELMTTVQDEDEWVALAAVRALGEAGPPAREAVPTLRRLLEPGSGWRHGRQEVKDVMATIDPASPSVGRR